MSTPRAGRRVAPRSPRAPRDRTALTALALVLVAGAAVGLTRGSPPDVAAGGTEGALVDAAQLACPTSDLPELTGRGVRTTAAAGLLDRDDAGVDLGAAGDLGSGPIGDDASPLDLARGELVALDDAADGPFLDARGEVAAGLFGWRTDRAGAASAVGACVAPRASWWFTGVGADLDHASELVLTNLDPGPAVVDVRVFGPDGEVDTVGTRGLTVAPGERVAVVLADIAPQSPELMVHVEASRGRVAVAASDRSSARPGAPAGVAWVPDAVRPSRSLRLAGVPAAAPTKTLLVGNPSDSEALVGLEVVGRTGSFTPTELDEVSVAPGTVEILDLADVLPRREAVGLRVSSQVPVVASLRAATRRDLTYASMTAPLTGAAVAPVPARTRTTLQLTSGATAGRVEVTAYDAGGAAGEPEEVPVDAGTTTTWRPPRDAAYVVVRPREGSVSGAAVYDGPAGLATAPLRTLPVRVRLPAVVPGPVG